MAQAEVQQDAQADEEVVLEGNTYEIIRNRLTVTAVSIVALATLAGVRDG